MNFKVLLIKTRIDWLIDWQLDSSGIAIDPGIDPIAKTLYIGKNIVRHTAHTIVSWPNPKQWLMIHTSGLMMIIR